MTGWTSDEHTDADGAVVSEQQLVTDRAPVSSSEDGALELGRVYWDTLESIARPFIAVRRGSDGGIAIRPLVGPTFLRLGVPELSVSDGAVGCRYPIEGGVLARKAGGSLVFRQETGEGGVTLRSTIEGFHPSLAARPGRPAWTGALYTLGQSRLHVALSRVYFDRVLERAA